MRKIAYHPSGTVIEFRSDDHSYIDDQDRRYVSTTRVVGEFFPPPDVEKLAIKSAAKKTGKYADFNDKNEILAMWDAERERGSTEGTNTHEFAEWIFDRKLFQNHSITRPKPISERCRSLFLGAEKATDWLWRIGSEPIGSEIIVFMPSFPLLSGTIDGLIAIPSKHRIIILDWKQNKQITDCSFYGEKGIGPFAKFDKCDFNKYAFQLSLYRYIIETEGYFDFNQWDLSAALIHLMPGPTNEGAFRVIKMPYLKNEVLAVREAWIGRQS